MLFSKAISCLPGANDDIVLPKDSVKGDWEVELGIVIGTEARSVDASDALNHVAGSVNGVRRPSGNTSTMIFKVAELVSYLSDCFTLWPGDLVCTGTPPGVGTGCSSRRLSCRS